MARKSLPKRIKLTADTELVAKLGRKLGEYGRRLAFQAPEVDPHATYKRWALETLLRTGSLDVVALRARCAGLSWFSAVAFDDAVSVIAAYNADDLGAVRGGTGLR